MKNRNIVAVATNFKIHEMQKCPSDCFNHQSVVLGSASELHDCFNLVQSRLAGEQRLAKKHFAQNATHGPHVDALGISATLKGERVAMKEQQTKQSITRVEKIQKMRGDTLTRKRTD